MFYAILPITTVLSICSAQNAAPVVTITSAQADTANHSITINFNATDADNDPLEITAFLSIDSGFTHLVSEVSLLGDVGYPVSPGSNKTLVLTYNPDSLAADASSQNAWSTVKVVATQGKITLRFPVAVQEAEVQVFDIEGRKIFGQAIEAQAREDIKIELRSKKKRTLPDGFYTVEVGHKDQRYTRKLILHQGYSH